MKVAVVYNRESQAVINLFGVPNREKYGMETISRIKSAIKAGGYQVKTFEGDKNLIRNLEEFMPSVISGERPGLVFNLSYGIQGRSRYMHVPGMLEMLGIPYVGSSPLTQAIALDKVVTKMILMQKGLPTPRFTVLDKPDSPLTEELHYPLIVKPKDEAVSFGLRIVRSEEELREGARAIFEMFKTPTLVEEYIEGREINIALLGNDPVEALPPVELLFGPGDPIYTYEDKTHQSGREVEKVCPAPLAPEETEHLQSLAVRAFEALGCYDSARVDFRLSKEGKPYILEINSMASLGPGSSFVFAAEKMGLDYNALVRRLLETASGRYFGTGEGSAAEQRPQPSPGSQAFHLLTQNRAKMEEELKCWTNLPSRTNDPVGLSTVVRKLGSRLQKLGLKPVEQLTNQRSAWTWQTEAGLGQGTLLVVPVDIPDDEEGYATPFLREAEWLYGAGIASSRAGLVCLLEAMETLRALKRLAATGLGVFAYSDEGRGMRYSSPLLQEAAKGARQVLVLQPGYSGGKIVNQRRGSRKFSIRVEGSPSRVGARGSQGDGLTWFLRRWDKIAGLSRPEDHLTVAVQDLHSERFSLLLPHKVLATVSITCLDRKLADQAEAQIRGSLTPEARGGIQVYVEKIEDRPPMLKNRGGRELTARLKKISEAWKLPFGTESSLLPSAAGEIPPSVPVLCGLGPASRGLYTPQEAVHRSELLQKALLLTMFLLGE